MSASTKSAKHQSARGSGKLSSNAPASSRKSGSGGSGSTSVRKRASGGDGSSSAARTEGSGLIVTRGLQEILDNDIKHRKVMKPSADEKGGKNGKTHRRSTGQAPNFVICYLCGRQFGSASIDIHRPQCYLKKMIEWERGDPALRGPKPTTVEEHEKTMKARAASAAAGGAHPGAAKLSGAASSRRANEIEMYNQMQMEAFNETSLAPCPNCGRTFLPDRLQVHLRSCRPGHVARPVNRPSPSPNISNNSNNNSASFVSPAAGAAKAAKAATGPTSTSTPIPGVKATDPQNQPIRTSGAYAIPEDAGIDSVPSQAPSAKKPSRNPSILNNATVTTTNSAPQGEMGEDVTEEAEPRDTVMDVEAEEVKPPSPRPDTERRLSSVAILRGDPDMSGSSAPNRPASMEPSAVPASDASPEEEVRNANNSNINVVYSFPQNRGRDHAAGSRPRRHGSASAPRTAPMPELVSEPHEDGEIEIPMHNGDDDDGDVLESAPVVGAKGRVCRVVECNPESEDSWHCSSSGVERRRWAPKKIPLNNVSRFKNVESRLKQQREAELSMFVPCQYCGRTFVPERIQRHEECCAERNKPPALRSVRLKYRPASAPTWTTKHAKSVPTTTSSSTANSASYVVATPAEPKVSPLSAAATPKASAAPASATALASSKAKFCGGCGVRISSDTQKFCTECGFKL